MKNFYNELNETIQEMVNEIKSVDYQAIVKNVAATMMNAAKKVCKALAPVAKAVETVLVIAGKTVYYAICLVLMVGYGIYLITKPVVVLVKKVLELKKSNALLGLGSTERRVLG